MITQIVQNKIYMTLTICHNSSLNIRSSMITLPHSITSISLLFSPSCTLLTLYSCPWSALEEAENSLLASENGSCLLHLSNSSLMGVAGLDASLDLWMGTFTGREVASRKLVFRVLFTISLWMGRKSGREQEREDFLDENVEEAVEFDTGGEYSKGANRK